MACYKSGGCGVYENRSCSECPASKPEYSDREKKPIIHAHWEDMWGGKYANPRYVCSACNGKALWTQEQDALLTWHDVQALTPFCPHCGAEMDI